MISARTAFVVLGLVAHGGCARPAVTVEYRAGYDFSGTERPAIHEIANRADGRRWIGFKVGTFLADRAVKASGLTLAQLAMVPTDQIIVWAQSP